MQPPSPSHHGAMKQTTLLSILFSHFKNTFVILNTRKSENGHACMYATIEFMFIDACFLLWGIDNVD